MTPKRPGPGRKLLAASLLATACPGGDPPCSTPDLNDAGMRCACQDTYGSDGKFHQRVYCDPDIGNPCTIGCFNPREPDGGRQYDDAGTPVCFC